MPTKPLREASRKAKGRAVKKSLSLTKGAWDLVKRQSIADGRTNGTPPNFSLTASRLIIRGYHATLPTLLK